MPTNTTLLHCLYRKCRVLASTIGLDLEHQLEAYIYQQWRTLLQVSLCKVNATILSIPATVSLS